MTTWKHLPQEVEGDYFFNGTMYVTREVKNKLDTLEIHAIQLNIFKGVQEQDGLDYLQVFEHLETGKKIFCIDNLSRSMLEEQQLSPKEKQEQEQNYWTMLFAEEY